MCLAVPGRILEIVDPSVKVSDDASDDVELAATLRLGQVDFGGAVRSISLAYLPEAGVGDWVIVHAGFALSLLTAEEAGETLELLSQLGAHQGDDSP